MLIRVCTCILLMAPMMHAQPERDSSGQSAPGAQKPPANDCAASGTVVNALTGEPIPRAMVSIGQTGEPGAATDAMGNWAIAKLACGDRMPMATRDGFVPANHNVTGAEAEKRIVSLVSGTPVTSVKISLMPGGVVAGTVRDSWGDPLPFAQVRLMRVRTQSGKRELFQAGTAASDAEGNFRIDGQEHGSYAVCAASQRVTYPVGGGEPLIFLESCFPGPLETALSNTFRLEPGREVRTTLTLTATRGVHVRGRISGAPAAAANAAVNAGPMSIQWIKVTSSGSSGTSVRAMRDGTFDIAPVQPGSYIATAMNPVQSVDSPAAQARVEVGSADIDNVVLTLQTPGSVAGTVRYELSHAAAGSAANLIVELGPSEGTTMFGRVPQARWDSDRLNFSFDGVAVGQYKIKTYLPGEKAYVRSATLRDQDVLNQEFKVDGPTGPIEIVVSDDTGGVDVTVRDKDGKPVAAYVVLIPGNGRERILVSGDDGHAREENIPPGEYRAWAFDDIDSVAYSEPDWMARNAGAGEKVTVTTAGTANVALKTTTVPTE